MSFNPELCHNESEVENQLIVNYLLPKLGYTADALYREVTFSSIRLDVLAVATQMLSLPPNESSLKLTIEATSPNQSLERHTWRPKLYLTNLSVPYAVLTNGKEIRIYQKFGDEIELVFQCAGAQIDANMDRIKGIIGREILEQRGALGIGHRASGMKCKEAIAPPTEPGTEAPIALPTEPATEPPTEVAIEAETDGAIAPLEPSQPQLSQSEPKPASAIASEPTSSEPIASEPTSSEQNPVSVSATSPAWQVVENQNLKVIAVYHNKGGVGKTTTTLNLAAALSKKGKRVLTIDLDSQANTTFAMAATLGAYKLDNLKNQNILHVLRSPDLFPISEVAITSGFSTPKIDVIPAHLDLVEYEAELNELDCSRVTLLQKLAATGDRYDIVIIDTPPALNLYAEIALIAADYLIIPSDLKPFSNQGLLNVKRAIARVNEFKSQIGKPPIVNLGVMPCKISTNASFRDHTLPKRLETISQDYGFKLMKSIISERADFAKSMEETEQLGDKEVPVPTSVLDYKPKSAAAKEVEALANEVLGQIDFS